MDTATTAPPSSGGMVNEVAVSLTIAPVAPIRSRRMIRAGFPAADADAGETVA